MSDNVIDEAAEQAAPPPPFNQSSAVTPPVPAVPSPADLARAHAEQAAAQQAAAAPQSDDGDGDGGKGGKRLETVDDYRAEVERLRKENAQRRTKLREVEPLAEKYREIEEGQKTELQKAQERAAAAEERDRQREEDFNRLNVAVALGIEPDNIDLIGSGSREEMEQRALRVKAMQDAQKAPTAPPSARPVEGLRPGASPEPPQPADDSYPEAWKPSHVRERERVQYGQ